MITKIMYRLGLVSVARFNYALDGWTRQAERANKAQSEAVLARKALKEISKCETQYANATVKRMANIARKALGEIQ